MQPKITTTITCIKCGGDIRGGESDYIVRCPYCGVEYQVSISAVMITPADVEEKIRQLAACITSGNPRERHEACLEMAKIRDWRVVEPVIRAYKELSSDVDRYMDIIDTIDALLEIIDKMDDPGAVRILAEALNDDSTVIRMHAAHALEKIGDPSSADAIIEAASDVEDMARSAYMDALGVFKDDRIPQILVSALDDTRYYVKCSALRSLGKLRYSGALESIISILDDRSERGNDGSVPWEEVRKWAAHALGVIGDEAALTPLIKALDDSDADVRKYTINALQALRRSSSDKAVTERIDKVLKEKMN